jgi:uncharacterized repeat protein (TIGR01451 family)
MRAKLAIAAALMITLLGAASAGAQANAANYSFSTTTTGSLTNMSSGTTQLLAANVDDTASPVTLLGFDFFFMGVRQDRFSINENGVLRFAAGAQAGSPYKPLAQAALPIVTAYGADQRTHAGDGKVHFKVTGSAPNRVATIEWLNNQADFNTGGTAGLTYQVRLSETTGCVEFAYGSMTMSAAGAADANSQNPNIGFSSSNAAGTVGSVTAAQSGTPAPTYNGASATPVANLYTAGAIPVLTSAVDGSRRTFLFCSAAPAQAGGPLTFTGVTQTGMTLNWTDSANEVGYAVYSSTDGGATYTFAGAAAQNATSFAASGLAPSTTYDWKVVATSEGALAAALTGTQATPAPTPKTSVGTGLWSAPGTWSPAGVPGLGDAVTIAAGHTVTIDTAASAFSVTVAGGGILQYEQTTARTLTVASNVNVQATGTFRSNPAGTITTHNLSLPGNLTNDGTLDFSTNADTAGAIITFTGTANTTFSGAGATTDIRQITVNKGITPAAIVELLPASFTVRGVTTDTVAGGWLVMSNGTIKISGTFAGTSRVFAAVAYTIPISFGFWLNNPNYVVAAQAGNAVNNGQFRLSQGAFNQGTLASHSFRAGTGAVFTIDGGILNAAGQFSPQNAVTYNQSGGTVNVGTVGNSQSNFGTFELFSASSTFNMTGGTINIVQASTGATQIDYQNLAVATAAAGTLRVGTGATITKFTFNLRGNNKTATATAQVNLLGTTLINAGTTLTINGQTCLVVGPTFTNNGTLTGTAAATRFYFLGGSGPTTYNGTGVVTAPLTAFEVDNVAGVTINPGTVNQIVTARFNNFSGGLTGSGKLTVGNGGATTAVVQLGVAGATQPVNGFDVPPVFNPGTGGVNLLYAPELTGRTTGPEMPPSRTLNLLSITNPNNITIAGGDVTVNGAAAGALALGSPRLITGPNTLYFNSAAGTVTRTTGYVDGNFRKSFAAVASKTFELGTANGYTPVVFNATAGTFPADVTVAAVQTPAPGIQPLTAVITRFWRLTATGITADVTFNYLDPADIPGTVTEANLHVLKHEAGNPADFSDQGGTINAAANTATVTGVTSFSDWTLGEAGADLSITKTDGVTTAIAGGSVTYTITASNGGTVGNPAATVADTFPAGLTCSTTCAGALGGTCAAGPTAGDINDTANIPSGGSVTYTAVCAISPSATGSLTNTATVSGGAVTDAVAANNSATDTDTLGLSSDLSITKTDGVTTATAGGSVTYTIVASNAGPSTATGATVADTFPASLTCTWTCAGAGGGTCAAAGSGNINGAVNLPSGGSVTYTASCAISAAATGTLSNTATVTAPAGTTDPTPGNNSATDSDTLAANSDLSITKTDGVTTATAGGSVTYTIAASNAGPSNATGATVVDTFPASLTCTWTCAGTGGGTCTGAGSGNINGSVNLPSGGSVTYTASCTISAAATGTLSNTATVTAPAGVTDSTPGNNSATDSDTLAASSDLSITKTDGVTTVTAGGSTIYTIVASNAGPSNATGATVADTFPASLTCTWTCTGAGGGTCTAAGSGNINGTVNLPSGGSVTYTASCTISGAATGTLSNTATVTAPAGVTDPTPGNNSATDSDTLGASADLSITKTDGVISATAGGSVTYTIVASNAGPSTATGATVADTFPASLTCTWTCAGAGGGTCTAAGSGNINGSVNLPSGGSVTYTASCAISAAATGSLSNTATVTAPAGVADPTPGNNSATDSDTLGASADLSITKTDGVTTATAGGSVTYTITASNAGPSNATGATVADTFPASLTCTWTCAGAGGGTCTAAGSGNINGSVNLPSGGSVTYTASCTISAAATGTLSNTATVTAPAGVTDSTPGNNSATDSDTLGASADLSITKTDGVTSATAGGSVTYTIVASNAGPSNATGATVADTFPASLTCTWTCTGTVGGTCTAAGSGNINDTANLPSGGSVTYTTSCTISASATGALSNTATVTAPAGVTDPTPGNNSATDSDTLGASADLSITKTDGVATATAGGSATYTIVASNAGPSNAMGATVADTFPASLTCTWTCTGAIGGTCTAAGSGNLNDTVNLPSGGSVTYTASCTISAAATGSLVNTATVAAPAGVTDPVPGNNSATDTDALGASADLSVTKTDGVTSVTAGGSATYTIVASNAGPSAATGATVTDTFPASLTCTWTCAGAGGGTCTAAGSGNIGDTVNLPSGGSVTYTASCTISVAATGTLANTATVTAPAGVTDPTPGNNSATDTDTVNAAPGASVSGTKTASGTFTPGSTVTYTIILTNSGTGAQADNPGNELIDVLPAQLTLVSATATSGSAVATVGTNTVTWNGAIPAAGTVTITITATINAGASGTISNQGTISYDTDGNGTNDGTAQTDDPATPGTGNPTPIVVVGGPAPPPIPTLSDFGLLALAAALAMMALAVMRRRRTGQAG